MRICALVVDNSVEASHALGVGGYSGLNSQGAGLACQWCAGAATADVGDDGAVVGFRHGQLLDGDMDVRQIAAAQVSRIRGVAGDMWSGDSVLALLRHIQRAFHIHSHDA